eukprot:50892-Alexandrium_andersonii.AAC.1
MGSSKCRGAGVPPKENRREARRQTRRERKSEAERADQVRTSGGPAASAATRTQRRSVSNCTAGNT